MANRIFNNILYFLSFLFFSFRLPQKQNLGSYDHPAKQKTHNQKSIILFCLFSSSHVRLYLTVHLTSFGLISHMSTLHE
jgi:hypothetical protein